MPIRGPARSHLHRQGYGRHKSPHILFTQHMHDAADSRSEPECACPFKGGNRRQLP